MKDALILAALLALYLGASTSEPRPTSTHQQGREGTIWYADASHGADYLAIPLGPGIRVKICGPRKCLTLTSTDAGPNRAMLLEGRIADVSIPIFRELCCDPSRGGFRGSWTRVSGPGMTLPPTDSMTEAVGTREGLSVVRDVSSRYSCPRSRP